MTTTIPANTNACPCRSVRRTAKNVLGLISSGSRLMHLNDRKITPCDPSKILPSTHVLLTSGLSA